MKLLLLALFFVAAVLLGCVSSSHFTAYMSGAITGAPVVAWLVSAIADYRAGSSLDVVDLTQLPRAAARLNVPAKYRKDRR